MVHGVVALTATQPLTALVTRGIDSTVARISRRFERTIQGGNVFRMKATRTFPSSYDGTNDNEDVLIAVGYFLAQKATEVKEARGVFHRKSREETEPERIAKGFLQLNPDTELEYDGFRISIVELNSNAPTQSVTPGGANIITLTREMTIRTHRSMDDVQALIREALVFYVKLFDPGDVGTRFLFAPRPSDDSKTIHHVPRRLMIEPDLTFDSIFFPEKDLLKRMLDELAAGQHKKITLLLHGVSGCGKTTLIRLIGAYTNRHFKVVKPSLCANDNQLEDCFFDPTMTVQSTTHRRGDYPGAGISVRTLEQDRLIFLMEEIDIELDVLDRKRKTTNPEAPPAPPTSTPGVVAAPVEAKRPATKMEAMMEMMVREFAPKVTLGSLLTTLDGVVPLNKALVILTTNHVDQIDDALLRPGRIDLKIELKPMLAVHARQLIVHLMTRLDSSVDWKTEADRLSLTDGAFTVAKISNACRMARNPTELAKALGVHREVPKAPRPKTNKRKQRFTIQDV